MDILVIVAGWSLFCIPLAAAFLNSLRRLGK